MGWLRGDLSLNVWWPKRRVPRDRLVNAVDVNNVVDSLDTRLLAPGLRIPTRIPVEVMRIIFSFCAQSGPPPTWIAATGVCHYWRTVAVEYPHMWSEISPRLSLHWVRIFMARSAPLPLRVDLVGIRDPDTRSALAAELLAVFPRVKTLGFTGSPGEMNFLIPTSDSAESLEALTLHSRSELPLVIPDNFVGGRAPRLRRLTLTSWTGMLAPAWLLRGITDFTVSGMVVLEELVLTLKNMPQLQILSVFLQGPTHSDIPEAVVADLPSLSLFKVGDYNPHSFWTLLSHLRMPATVRMRLLLTPIAAASWESWSDFLHAMNSLLLPRMRDTFRQVHIRGGPYDGHICAWTTALSEDSADATLRPPEAARFVFHVMWKESFLKPFSAQGRTFSSPFFHLPTLCFHLAVKEVTALTITQDLYHDAVPSSHWFSLLLHFSALESLTLHGSTPGLFAAISALLPAVRTDQYPMVLPHLKKLTISSVKINSASMPEPGSDYFSSMKRTLARRIAKPERNDITDELMTFLWDRAPSRVACPLELVLLGCDVDVLAAKALRDCVGELRVTQDPYAPPEGLDQKARYILDSKCVDLDSPLTSMMFAT